MGLGSTATVRLEIVILDGKAALAMRRFDQVITRTSRGVARANRRFIRMGSIFGTITKALISMVAVLIAFNLLITLPQRIFQGFVTVLGAAIRTVSEFEQRILGLQAILATPWPPGAPAIRDPCICWRARCFRDRGPALSGLFVMDRGRFLLVFGARVSCPLPLLPGALRSLRAPTRARGPTLELRLALGTGAVIHDCPQTTHLLLFARGDVHQLRRCSGHCHTRRRPGLLHYQL